MNSTAHSASCKQTKNIQDPHIHAGLLSALEEYSGFGLPFCHGCVYKDWYPLKLRCFGAENHAMPFTLLQLRLCQHFHDKPSLSRVYSLIAIGWNDTHCSSVKGFVCDHQKHGEINYFRFFYLLRAGPLAWWWLCVLKWIVWSQGPCCKLIVTFERKEKNQKNCKGFFQCFSTDH